MMNIPAKLKSHDIARFAQRAAQVEKIKPAIAYWCYYWIVNQILAKGLHNADDECKTYTTNLVDKLEQMKSQYATDDAIIDDMAGQAFVEQFGQETFLRADNAVRANKASRQTAETFQASATFLDLVQIWGPPSPEIAAKIKYAKVHALRIIKAIKAGEDPNLSNPAPEPPTEADTVALDPNDPEVRQIIGDQPAAMHQASVEDVPDQHDLIQPRLARQSSLDQSLHPSRDSSVPARIPSPNMPGSNLWHMSTDPPQADVSPPQQPSVNSRQGSIGGGYFPQISPPSEPSIPPASYSDPPEMDLARPSVPSLQDFTDPTPPPESIVPPSNFRGPVSPPQAPPARAPQAPSISPQSFYQQPPQPRLPQPVITVPSTPDTQNYIVDDLAMVEAQKHAKWAISALNFEDVNTAVKELRIALRALGAT